MAEHPVLVVTGASSGIGAATARAAVEAGFDVVIGARSTDRLEELAAQLGDERALARRCDVTSFEDQEALVAAALERFGRLDAFLANAGFGAKRGFLEESIEHWRAMVETNVLGVAFSIRAALAHFRESGRGHMVLMSSVAGRRTLPGSLYSATKWAVTAMGQSLRAEVAESDIKVTTIEPGMVDTRFFETPPKEGLRPEDIARAVVFTLSQPPHVDVNEVLVRPIHQAG
jgi:NADP-dependent 3-hydroxy acid dehydrogenase YdfG